MVSGLCGTDRASLNTILQHLGPRFLSLRLPGHSLLLYDLVHACHSILSSDDVSATAPRTQAVSILADLLSLASNDVSSISVLQPDPTHLSVRNCPDIKVILILLYSYYNRNEMKYIFPGTCCWNPFASGSLRTNGRRSVRRIISARHLRVPGIIEWDIPFENQGRNQHSAPGTEI